MEHPVQSLYLSALLSTTLIAFGPNPVFAVECGDVITEDTVLDRDLQCEEDGLVVGARGLVLDLGGHEIRNIWEDYTGIRNPGYADVQIVNGAIRDFDRGVVVADGAQRIQVRDLDIRAVELGVSIRGSDHARLQSLTIVGYGDGIRIESSDAAVLLDVESVAEGEALSLLQSNDARIRSSRFDGGPGVVVYLAFRTWFVGNEISGGLYLSSSERNWVWRNAVGGDEYKWAMALDDSHDNSIARNRVGGISLSDSHDNSIVSNEVWANDTFGIALTRSDRTRVLRNLVQHGNDEYVSGVGVYSGIANLIGWNRVQTGNPGCQRFEFAHGISVGPDARETILSHNFVTGMSRDGILVAAATTKLTANRADSNCYLGIEAFNGVAVTDGGRNTASGNGNPAQCLGVECDSP